MVSTYDGQLVALSILVAVITSYTALDLARIIHKQFCCNRGFAARAREASFVKREAQAE